MSHVGYTSVTYWTIFASDDPRVEITLSSELNLIWESDSQGQKYKNKWKHRIRRWNISQDLTATNKDDWMNTGRENYEK